MRINVVFLLICAIIAGAFAADKNQNQKYVSPTKEKIGIYKNEVRELYEQPLLTVGTQDRLLVIQDKGRNYKVQMADGATGWIEKQSVVATGKSKTFIFDNAEVIGYLDNPTPVYIIDADDPNSDPINLDRSFKDALRENTDRETVERQVK